MNILLLGGTGTLSTAVRNLAVSKGYMVSIFNRGNHNVDIPKEVSVIIGNFKDKESLRKDLLGSNYDVVVDFLSRKPEDIERSYSVLGSCCKQYIFISTACVYRRNEEDFPLCEDSPKPNIKWSYNTEKYACEKKLKQLSLGKDTCYTIVRPYITYDDARIPFGIAPDYKYHRTLIERIKNGKPMFVWDDGMTLTTSTHVSEFAVGLVGLFLNPKGYNEDFHITSTFSYPTIDLLNLLYEKLRQKPQIIKYTRDELSIWLPQYRDMLMGDRALPAVFDNNKIKNAVPEYDSKIKLTKGLDRILEHYNNINIYEYDYEYEGVIDRLLEKKGVSCNYIKYPCSENRSRWVYYIYRYFPYSAAKRLSRLI